MKNFQLVLEGGGAADDAAGGAGGMKRGEVGLGDTYTVTTRMYT